MERFHLLQELVLRTCKINKFNSNHQLTYQRKNLTQRWAWTSLEPNQDRVLAKASLNMNWDRNKSISFTKSADQTRNQLLRMLYKWKMMRFYALSIRRLMTSSPI